MASPRTTIHKKIWPSCYTYPKGPPRHGTTLARRGTARWGMARWGTAALPYSVAVPRWRPRQGTMVLESCHAVPLPVVPMPALVASRCRFPRQGYCAGTACLAAHPHRARHAAAMRSSCRRAAMGVWEKGVRAAMGSTR